MDDTMIRVMIPLIGVFTGAVSGNLILIYQMSKVENRQGKQK